MAPALHNGIMHCATVPSGAVSVLIMHLLRQGARLRNEAHVAHVAGTEEGSVETEEGRRGGSGHEQEPSPNLETLSQ